MSSAGIDVERCRRTGPGCLARTGPDPIEVPVETPTTGEVQIIVDA